MFWAVFRVEQQNLLRQRAIWGVLLCFALVVVYAAASGGSFARAEQRTTQAALADEAARLAALRRGLVDIERGAPVQGGVDPREPYLIGRDLGRRVATLPPAPLSAVSIGQRDLLPHVISVSTEARLFDSGVDEKSLVRRVTGAFDLCFVLVFLLPLMVIALSFDLLSGERERGTLALVLSQPISLSTFMLSKMLLRALLLLMVVLLAGIVAPLIAAGVMPSAALGLPLGLYAALLVAYTGFWFCLAACINAFGRSSAGNALSLVSVWLLLVVVIPGLLSVVVDTVHPSPSRVELVNRAREASREAEAQVSAIEGDHGVTMGIVGGAQRRGERAVEVQSELSSRVQPVLEAFREQLARQQSLVDRLRFFSPAIALHESLNEVAGTDVTRHQHFSDAVERFHSEFRQFFFERIQRGSALTLSDYDRLPRFEYQERPARERVARLATGLLGLVLPAMGLLVLSLFGFRRAVTRGLR